MDKKNHSPNIIPTHQQDSMQWFCKTYEKKWSAQKSVLFLKVKARFAWQFNTSPILRAFVLAFCVLGFEYFCITNFTLMNYCLNIDFKKFHLLHLMFVSLERVSALKISEVLALKCVCPMLSVNGEIFFFDRRESFTATTLFSECFLLAKLTISTVGLLFWVVCFFRIHKWTCSHKRILWKVQMPIYRH